MTSSPVIPLLELMLSESAERRRDAGATLLASSPDDVMRVLHRNNVTLRALYRLRETGGAPARAFVDPALEAAGKYQRTRLVVLAKIAPMLDEAGVRYVIHKTLDSWPDSGTDIDILTTGSEGAAHVRTMLEGVFPEGRWQRPRKVCDMLSAKWTFEIPGLCDPEIHVGRVGQVGEHRAYPRVVIDRRVRWDSEAVMTWVPAAEDRLLLAVLQRTYRHFWFRVGDLVNGASWIAQPALDWAYVWATAERMGVRRGLERYLGDVLGVVEGSEVGGRVAAALRGRVCHLRRLPVRRDVYRMAVFRDPLVLYAAKLGHDLSRGRLTSAARVSLVFPLGSLGYLLNTVFGHEPIW